MTQHGYGKRTKIEEYRVQSRGGKGIKTLKVRAKNGNVVGHSVVSDKDDLIIVTQAGMVIRLKAKEISTFSRNTQGVRLINVNNDQVSNIAVVPPHE